jgi:hypothetical protein
MVNEQKCNRYLAISFAVPGASVEVHSADKIRLVVEVGAASQ